MACVQVEHTIQKLFRLVSVPDFCMVILKPLNHICVHVSMIYAVVGMYGTCRPLHASFLKPIFFFEYQESKTSNLLICIGPGTLPFLFCVSHLNLNWQSLKFQLKTKKNICLTKALLGFGTLLHWSEVPFLQLHVRLELERFFLSQPVLLSVTRAIF